MSEQPAATPGASTVTTGQEPTTPVTQTPAPNSAAPAAAPSIEELQATLERERKERQDANKEAQATRAKLRQLEQADEERRKAAMTEEEKIKAEVEALRGETATLKAERQSMLISSAVQSAAVKLGIVDPEAALKLLDADALKLGDDGRPTNTEDALKKLLDAKPYLLGQTGNSSTTNPGRGSAATIGEEAELRKLAYGQGASIFDFSRIQRAVGGK